MKYIIYHVKAEEKLSDIAKKHNTTPEEIKALNPDATMFRSSMIGPMYVGYNQKLKIPVQEEEEISLQTVSYNKEAKYRCEQSVVSKINGMIQNYANTKYEYLVKKQESSDNLIIKIELTDSIIEMYPKQLTEALQLLNDLDLIKCNAVIYVDTETGKIDRILNHDEIIKQWRNHRTKLEEKYGFIRSPQMREELHKFIALAENQIIDERNLIQDLNTKLFFNLFFDKYLIRDKRLFDSYTRTFHSHLFEDFKVVLHFNQKILSETAEKVSVKKTGVGDKKENNYAALESRYDTKFKPIVKYKFSSYDYKYDENYIVNTKEHWLETSEVVMIEEVKNNIQIGINFNLKKIE